MNTQPFLFTEKNGTWKKKLKQHYSNTKLQQIYEFKVWLFVMKMKITHIFHICTEVIKSDPLGFNWILIPSGLLKQNKLSMQVEGHTQNAVSWMWASSPLKGGSFASEISSWVVIDLTEILSCLHTFILNHVNIYSFLRLIIHNRKSRKMLGRTTKTSITALTPSCPLKILTI